MRIHIYKEEEGRMSVLVEPSPGRGQPPVLLQNITEANVVGEVRPVVDALRRPRWEEPGVAGLD